MVIRQAAEERIHDRHAGTVTALVEGPELAA